MIRALRNPSCLNPWKKFQDICIYRLQQSIFKDSHEFLVNVMGKPQLAAKVTVLISYPRVINQMRRTNWKAFLVPELSTAQPPMCQRRIITPTLQGWCENSILHGCKVFSKNPHVWLWINAELLQVSQKWEFQSQLDLVSNAICVAHHIINKMSLLMLTSQEFMKMK